VPLDYEFELGMVSRQNTPTKKDGTGVKIVDWTSSSRQSHATIVPSLEVDDERPATPSSFLTMGPDGKHTLQLMEMKDELVPVPRDHDMITEAISCNQSIVTMNSCRPAKDRPLIFTTALTEQSLSNIDPMFHCSR
jgi:hypothetical protein